MNTRPPAGRTSSASASGPPDGMQVIIDPANPFDFDEAEIAELVQDLQQLQPDAEIVAHFRDETEYGGALMEVLHVWVVGRDFIDENWPAIALIAGAVKWLRKRWRSDKEANPEHPRPRSILVYDEEERLRFSIRIDQPDGEPITESVDRARHSHRRPTGAKPKSRDAYDHELDGM